MRLEDSFHVPVSVEDAWLLLNDVPRVVPCMPGAELVETLGEDSWKAVMHVRLGPIGMKFETDVVREVKDDSEHRVVLQTKARETRGRGAAATTIESRLTAGEDGTRVDIVSDVSLQGTVAQFGRGIVPEVAAQLTKRFASNLAALLEPAEGASSFAQPASSFGVSGGETMHAVVVRPVSGARLGLLAVWRAIRRWLGGR